MKLIKVTTSTFFHIQHKKDQKVSKAASYKQNVLVIICKRLWGFKLFHYQVDSIPSFFTVETHSAVPYCWIILSVWLVKRRQFCPRVLNRSDSVMGRNEKLVWTMSILLFSTWFWRIFLFLWGCSPRRWYLVSVEAIAPPAGHWINTQRPDLKSMNQFGSRGMLSLTPFRCAWIFFAQLCTWPRF